MTIAGQTLYRVNYKFLGIASLKEKEFTKLVVAYSEKEAAAYIGNGVTLIQVIETDISMLIPDQYLIKGDNK